MSRKTRETWGILGIFILYCDLNIGRANSSCEAVSGCSAFHLIAAVIRVLPLG